MEFLRSVLVAAARNVFIGFFVAVGFALFNIVFGGW